MKTIYVLKKYKRQYCFIRKLLRIINGIVCATSLFLSWGLVGATEIENIPTVAGLIGAFVCIFIFGVTVGIFNKKPKIVIFVEEMRVAHEMAQQNNRFNYHNSRCGLVGRMQ